jgi:hypothetical protein
MDVEAQFHAKKKERKEKTEGNPASKYSSLRLLYKKRDLLTLVKRPTTACKETY